MKVLAQVFKVGKGKNKLFFGLDWKFMRGVSWVQS